MDSANIELSEFHLNIKSLNANSSKLMQLVSSLDLKFDVIILSEIWTYNIQFYSNILQQYNCLHDLPNNSSIGGAGIFVHNKLKYRLSPELQFKNCEVIEIIE